MRLKSRAFHAAIVLPSLFLSSFASALSISSSTYLDELATSRTFFPEVKREEVLKSLSEGNLISIGETHERGMERTYLKNLYDRLKPVLSILPTKCLVENYDVLLSTDDPVRASFNPICPAEKVFNQTEGSNYTSELSDNLKNGLVLTHTGYRHVFPIALLYPLQDFPSPQWVDIPEHGTIAKQLPAQFEQSGMQMRGLAMRGVDDLYMSRVATDVQAFASSTVPELPLAGEAEKVRGWAASLHFNDGEEARLFEIHRINLSFPYAKAYVALLNRKEFDPELLARLLESDQLKKLLQTTDPGNLIIDCFIANSPNESFGAGSVNFFESGTIYAYSTSLTNQHTVVVSISHTHDVKTEYSTF